jgi:hypothetical protein
MGCGRVMCGRGGGADTDRGKGDSSRNNCNCYAMASHYFHLSLGFELMAGCCCFFMS